MEGGSRVPSSLLPLRSSGQNEGLGVGKKGKDILSEKEEKFTLVGWTGSFAHERKNMDREGSRLSFFMFPVGEGVEGSVRFRFQFHQSVLFLFSMCFAAVQWT